jgi:hypothetical protein
MVENWLESPRGKESPLQNAYSGKQQSEPGIANLSWELKSVLPLTQGCADQAQKSRAGVQG